MKDDAKPLSGEKKTARFPVWTPPGGRRPRLPRALAWAVDVERLSARFAHVPQCGSLRVWFSDRPLDAQYSMEEIIRYALPYQVFTVRYSVYGDPHWCFMVYPVESRRSPAILALLEAEAFPLADAWLCEPKPETWSAQPKRLRFIFDQGKNRIDAGDEN